MLLRLIAHNIAARWLFFTRGALYAIAFSLVLGVAMGDPSGFVLVLEIFTSLALNMANGVLISTISDRSGDMDGDAPTLATTLTTAATLTQSSGYFSTSSQALAMVDPNAGPTPPERQLNSGSFDGLMLPGDASSRLSYNTVDFSSDTEDIHLKDAHRDPRAPMNSGGGADATMWPVSRSEAGYADVPILFRSSAAATVGSSAQRSFYGAGAVGIDEQSTAARVGGGTVTATHAAKTVSVADERGLMDLPPLALPLDPWVRQLCSTFCLFTFSGAVLYDAFTSLQRIVPLHSAMFWTIGIAFLFWRYAFFAAFHEVMQACCWRLQRRGRRSTGSSSGSRSAWGTSYRAGFGGVCGGLLNTMIQDSWQCAVASMGICIGAGAATLERETDAALIGLVCTMLVINEIVAPLVSNVFPLAMSLFGPIASLARIGIFCGGIAASAINGGDAAMAFFSVAVVVFAAIFVGQAITLCRS